MSVEDGAWRDPVLGLEPSTFPGQTPCRDWTNRSKVTKEDDMPMKLMTKALEKRFAQVGRQDVEDPIVIAKYFLKIA